MHIGLFEPISALTGLGPDDNYFDVQMFFLLQDLSNHQIICLSITLMHSQKPNLYGVLDFMMQQV